MNQATVISKRPVSDPIVTKWAFKPVLVILLVVASLVMVAAGRFFLLQGLSSSITAQLLATRKISTPAPTPTSISVPTSEPTARPTEILELATATPTHMELLVAPTAVPVLGKADKIAFVANNEIWSMDVDGRDLQQLTTDGAAKNDLQWLNRDTLLFLSGKTVKYYLESTGSIETLTSFPSAISLDAFRVSHNGSQVIIALSREVFVVPFSFETMKDINTRADLLAMQGACILPTVRTKADLAVEEARWSADDKQVAWLYRGVYAGNTTLQAEQIGVFDISACRPEAIDTLDNFPGNRFDPVGYQNREIPDFDWDGYDLFTFNTHRRNNGWGELYLYNWKTFRANLINPIGGGCCYRDARLSPDSTYLFFAFQDQSLGAEAPTALYYVASGELGTGANFQPLPLDTDFFKDRKEAVQPALRPTE